MVMRIKKLIYFHKNDLSLHRFFYLLMAKYSVGGGGVPPDPHRPLLFSRSVPVPDFVILCTKLEFQMALPVTGFVCVVFELLKTVSFNGYKS